MPVIDTHAVEKLGTFDELELQSKRRFLSMMPLIRHQRLQSSKYVMLELEGGAHHGSG
jgi:hypothetical protein